MVSKALLQGICGSFCHLFGLFCHADYADFFDLFGLRFTQIFADDADFFATYSVE